MSKPEWGIKRVCPSCSIKYYDFNKNPIICPKCEFEFEPDLLLKSRKGRSIATKNENNIVSNDTQKETETLEEDINSLENDEDILEIDDETDVEEGDVGSNLEDNVNEDNEDNEDNDDIEVIDDDINENDEFSIEIDDEIDDDSKNQN